jgi:hypothetical protein
MVHLCYLYLLKYIVVQRDFYQLVFVSFNSNTTGVTCGEGTLPEHPSSSPVLVRFILLDLYLCMLLYLFTYTVAQHDFHQMMFVSFNSITKLLTLPEHMSSLPVKVGFVLLDLLFSV